MTDSDRFKHLEALFHELDALPAKERQARLTKLAAEDSALHAELIQLIDPSPTRAEDAQALDFVVARGGLSASLGGVKTDPERVGPYRLVRAIGEGGMGRVYLAEQSETVKRRVALKLGESGTANLGQAPNSGSKESASSRTRHSLPILICPPKAKNLSLPGRSGYSSGIPGTKGRHRRFPSTHY